jgi:hypothetical protein
VDALKQPEPGPAWFRWWASGGHDRDEPSTAGGGTLVAGHTWLPGPVMSSRPGAAGHSLHNPEECEPVRSGQTPTEVSGWVWEVFEHFSGGVAFQDPGDLSHGFAFCESPGDVVAGLLVVTHPGDHDVIQRRVGLPVASAVEPMPGHFP